MGKSESGALWLSAEKTSPYQFYQYWINLDDADVGRCLRFFSDLGKDEIDALLAEHQANPSQRSAQCRLAAELTQLVHGPEGLRTAQRATEIFFGAEISDLSDAQLAGIFADVPSRQLPRERLSAVGFPFIDALVEAGLAKSKGEARRTITQGGAYVNNRRRGDRNATDACPSGERVDDDIAFGKEELRVVAVRIETSKGIPQMSRRTRLLVFIGGGLAVSVVLGLLGLYLAVLHEPAFYRKAMELEPAVLEKASDRMLQKAAAIQSALNTPGRWTAVITAEEINGWLAVDRAKNHPNLLPPKLSNLRLAIRPDQLLVGCRFEKGGISSVLSLTLQPCCPSRTWWPCKSFAPGRGDSRGAERVIDGISKAARDMQIHGEWRHAGNDPVVLLSLPKDPEADHVVRIESLVIADGEIRIVGVTERRKP